MGVTNLMGEKLFLIKEIAHLSRLHTDDEHGEGVCWI